MGGDTLKISILNRQELKNCDPNKRIVVQLRLDNPPDGYYFFKWTSLGVMTTTESRTVQLAFPSWYCGTEIEVKVVAVKNRFAPSDNFVSFNPTQIKNDNPSDRPIPLRNDINEASIKFTPTCNLQLLKIDWFDRENKLIGENDPIRSNRYYLIDVNIAGMNNERLTGNFVSDYHVVPISVTVVDNHAYIPFFADIKFLREKKSDKDSRETEINLNLFRNSRDLRSNRQVINGISKKIMLADSTLNLVEPITSFPLQPVVVGTINIVENNFLPCKYTAIEIESVDKKKESFKKLVFDENRSIKVSEMNIIGGENTLNFTLKDYNTKKCNLKKSPHKANSALLRQHATPLPEEITIPDDGKLTIKIVYDYGPTVRMIGSAADPSSLFSDKPDYSSNDKPFSNSLSLPAALALSPFALMKALLVYFWPTRKGLIQRHSINIETCRHPKIVDINIFPDIEFNFGFVYSDSIGEQYIKDKGIIVDSYTPYSPYEEEAKVAEGVDFKSSFKLALSATLDDGTKLSIERGVAKKVIVTFKTLALLKTYLSQIFNIEDSSIGEEEIPIPQKYVETTHTLNGKTIADNSKPFSVYVEKPKVAIGVKWKAAYDEHHKDVGTEISAYVKLDPLLSVGLYIDIIAFFGKYGGAWGAVVEGIRIFLKLAANTTINLYIIVFGKMSVEGDVDLKKVDRSSDNELISGQAEVGIQAGLEVHLELKVLIMEVTFDAEIYGKGSIYYKIALGTDDEGLYYRSSAGNTSVDVTGKVKATVKFSDEKEEPEETPVHIKESKEKKAGTGLEKTVPILPKKEWWKGDKNRFTD